MADNHISIAEMARYITDRTARPLLPEGVPGPVHYHQRWWAVSTEATEYKPVTDPATIAMLTRHASVLAGSATRLAAAAATDAVRER